MDKKTILAVVISLAILLAWQFWFTPDKSVVTPPVPSAEEKAGVETAFPAGNETSSSAALNAALLGEEKRVPLSVPFAVSTDLLTVRFDNSTGDIRDASILGWKDTEDGYVTFNKGGGYNYMRISAPIVSGYDLDVRETPDGKIVSYTAKAGDVVVTKQYELKNGSYLVTANVRISNAGASTLQIPVKVSVGPGLGDGFEESKYIFEGAIIANKKSVERVQTDKSKTEELTNPTWGGYTSKYFLFAAAAGNFSRATIAPQAGGEVASLEGTSIVNPGDRADNEFQIYVGPKEYNELKDLGLGLQKSIDFGWFYFLAIPMLQFMIFIYGYVHNYGVAIIILTIIIKILTLPLTMKGMKSMKAMSKLQPEMLALKEKFKGDPQKLNMATMELYKKHGVNPMSGCLPLLIQIPIFFALYKALLLSIELKDAPFFGWIVDLSAKDPYYITPIIMGITMFIQQKMTPSTADPMQQKIFLAMPIIFTFLFLNFPSGLVIYWLTNNVLSIIQQYFVNKKSA